MNFLVRLLLGHPGNVPGTNRVCPRDKVGLSQGQTQVFFLFYTAEAPVCPWDKPGLSRGQTRGRRAADRVYVLKVYVPFSFPIKESPLPFGWRRGRLRQKIAAICDYDVWCSQLRAGELLRAARMQNDIAPEKLLNRYEERFENAKRDPKNDPKRV